MTVEDYLNAVGEWRNDQDLILEFTAGEFLARLDVQYLPHVGEYAARFPHLESQIRQKLSDLSTNGTGNTSMVASIRESLDRVFEIDDICDAFGRLWRESPTAPFIEAWVLHGRREERPGLLKELLRVALCVRVERKEAPTLQEYRQRFADESPFRDILNDWEQHPQQYMLTGVPSTKQVSPQEAGATLIGQFPVHSSQSGTLELDGSQRIGHFRLLKQLGRGTFGRVYRAHDEQLERAVAIKVPRRSRFRRPEDAEAYLAEARTVARLDHPGIVPVYQAGRSDDGAVYVVSRLIEGRSLEEVKAGLLPHLSKDVIAVYLEATPEDTELRILRGLRKRVESLDSSAELQGGNVGWTFLSDSISTGKNAHPTPNRSLPTSAPGLTETILHLRRGQHQKIVIIIDQFEQWLHAHRAEPDAELVRALRQCDGVHVQAIVMIRDDFAMAAARFMQALDVSIVQGQNFATVDLFEIDHAKNVLLKFGQAFGKLPANRENLSADENQFVSDIAHGLSQDSKVVSVRLSLFAEMIKTKRWMPETLQAVGGTEGIGVNFLEETFSSPQANPRHRLHATAARAVLNALLPELGSDIKGHMRSQQEVLEASGYQDRPTDFTDLLRILDGELRLITPTDPEGDSLSGDSSRNSSLAPRYYQLTHDYLVPSLRDWLTRKQRETRTGLAELKLAERSAIWNAKRENKQLPTVTEWLSIRVLTNKKRWTDSQRVMLRKAARVHGTLWGGLLLTVLLVGTGIQQWASAERWKNLREQTRAVAESLQDNLGPTVPVNLKELGKLPTELVLPELQTRFSSATNARHKLALAFALAGYGELDAKYLVSQIDDIKEADTRNYVTA